MELETKKFTEAVKAMDRNPSVNSLNQGVRDWLVVEGIPDEIIEFLNLFCFSSSVKFGFVYFNCPNDIKVKNTEEQNRTLVENGYLIVGSGLNGDPIAIDLATGNVVYACHDVLWEEEKVNLSEVVHDTGMSVGAFYYGAQFIENFPVDYYMALERE